MDVLHVYMQITFRICHVLPRIHMGDVCVTRGRLDFYVPHVAKCLTYNYFFSLSFKNNSYNMQVGAI